ncbi:hypothetical protein E4U60_005401 [Claviceps pazoutovae]|uniref:Uncharacterized protein n=1 Tax=Claviceps pazoutovae TaxID=1649127 RepID=A0A9P7SE81_9HYPO|nr:hypothetical protein E4U60_005401 [Claviceps pazoutovae]
MAATDNWPVRSRMPSCSSTLSPLQAIESASHLLPCAFERNHLFTSFRRRLTLIELPAFHITGQSCRRNAAQFADEAGSCQEQIQTLGRWWSGAVDRYHRACPQHLRTKTKTNNNIGACVSLGPCSSHEWPATTTRGALLEPRAGRTSGSPSSRRAPTVTLSPTKTFPGLRQAYMRLTPLQ